MSQPSNKHSATTPPQTDEASQDEQMNKYLHSCGFFEDESTALTRERVLGRLDHLVKKFVHDVAVSKKMPTPEGKSYGGKIFTFGSYRLGVHSKGADIDVLCIAPKHVSRKDFFNEFYSLLKNDEFTTDITKIEEAYVPIIKIKYQGIPIDLTFARLCLPVIPNNISLLNDVILKNMDEKCVVSLNGSRVTDEILALVPNVSVFHSALRCIKYWGKRRCVYGNSYGYLAGVSFSISVARVCQQYPNATAYQIVRKFFEFYSTWKWPSPIMLKPIVDLSYNMKVWDPKIYPSDRYHKMPVITPAYPSMCATHNVTSSTHHLFMTEIQRGHEIMSKSTGSIETTLCELFTLTDFFNRYKLFVQVLAITSEDGDQQDTDKDLDIDSIHAMWVGYLESKIRILSTKIENLELVSYAYPFPQMFDVPKGALSTCVKASNPYKAVSFFIALQVPSIKYANNKLYIDQPVQEFLDFVCDHDKKTKNMIIEVRSMKRKDVYEFLKTYYDNR